MVITHSYGTIALLQTYTSAPFTFQRLVAAKSSAEARRAMWICAIISVPLSTFFYLIGTCGSHTFLRPTPNAPLTTGSSSRYVARGVCQAKLGTARSTTAYANLLYLTQGLTD